MALRRQPRQAADAFALTTAPITIGLGAVAKTASAFGGIANMAGFGWPVVAVALGAHFAVGYTNRRKIATINVEESRLDLNRNLVSRIRIDPSGPGMLRILFPTVPTRRIGRSPKGVAFGEQGGVVLVGRVAATDDDDADRLQEYVSAEGDLSHLLRVIMPIVNEAGAQPSVISDATDVLLRYDPDPREILFGRRKDWKKAKRLTLADVSEPRRLALEMLVHEESERRWLAGELKALEAEWLRAEEIASIADGLTRDPAIEARLNALSAEAPGPNASDHTTR